MSIFNKILNNKNKSVKICDLPLPQHIAIIMDGNGRWAKKRHLNRSAGHIAGASNVEKIAKYANKLGIKYLTVYAFSTENWKRPEEEISNLMNIFRKYLKKYIKAINEDNIKLRFIGDISSLSPDIQKMIEELTILCENASGMVVNIAINYGSRSEITRATREIAKAVLDKKLNPSDINDSTIENFLYTAQQPDVDLVIRTSNEFRTSNFLLWQSAYAEYYITDVLWPDFNSKCLDEALIAYSHRNRRFGGLGDSVKS